MTLLETVVRSLAALGCIALVGVFLYNAPMIYFLGWFFGFPLLLAGIVVAGASAIFAYKLAKPLLHRLISSV